MNAQPAPLVSVIIPCYNLGQYLDEAVQSVLDQTLQESEILVVDDGSTDPRTVQLLDTFERSRTTVHRTANQGLAAARNYLIERARGTYLCALDADDRLHPEYFEKALARFEGDPGLSFVSSWLQAFGEESWTWRQSRCDLAALLAEDTVMTAALVRRTAVLAVGGYDEQMPHPGDEDWDLWLRLVKAGYRGEIIPETLFFYRRRAGSMSTECVEGETHLDLVGYLVDKHREVYRRHLPEVLLLKEQEISSLLRANDEIERELAGELSPALELRRAELEVLHRRLAAAERQQPASLEARFAERESYLAEVSNELSRTRREVEALRSSWSWRMTAPLRALWELLARLRRAR